MTYLELNISKAGRYPLKEGNCTISSRNASPPKKSRRNAYSNDYSHLKNPYTQVEMKHSQKEKWFIHFSLPKEKSKRPRTKSIIIFFDSGGQIPTEIVFSRQNWQIFKEKWFIHISLPPREDNST
jgi:hypothetical protein